MAKFVKLRDGLIGSLEVARICKQTGISVEHAIYCLYRLASWFDRFGKHGKFKYQPDLIDSFLEVDDFSESLASVDWLRVHDGVVVLRGFCTVNAERKSFGKKTRRAILGDAKCMACGATNDLVIDHIIPVCRGGSSELNNLQPLCAPCNSAKGKLTMAEFVDARLLVTGLQTQGVRNAR